MLRRILAAIPFDKNRNQKGKLALKLFNASKILPSMLYANPSTSYNITDNTLDLKSESIRSTTIPSFSIMSANAESRSTSSIEQDIDLKHDSLDGWITAEDDSETLDALQESYLAAKQESTSKWLDYNKTCYVYLYRGGGEPSDVMAAFDLDGTIIKPKSNKRIPKSATDWQFFSVWTKVKVQQALRENKARFVIFTNQNGVGLKIVPLEEVQERIELVTSRLNIPCTVFVAIDKDEFRKPNVGMFNLFLRSFNDSRSIDRERSFYCGDAVGYPSHSDADIKFAQTLRLPFLPPEKFLRGVKPKLVETGK